MKQLFKKVLLVLLAAGMTAEFQVIQAQNYHFKKGEEYYELRWYDSAFREYNAGRKAGEASSALSTAICYLYEKGTPRDVKKAIAILDEWSKKDAAVCLYTAIFWDPEHVYHGLGGFDKIKGVSVVGFPPRVYDIYNWKISRFIPENLEEYGIKSDIGKARKYAAQLVSLVNTDAARQYLTLLNERGKSFTDKLKEWSANSPGGYYPVLEGAINECASLADLENVMETDRTKNVLTSENHHYTEVASLKNYTIHEIFAKKCYSLYEQLYNEKQGNLEQIQGLLKGKDYKLIISDAIPIMIEECSREQLDFLVDKMPTEDLSMRVKTIWTRSRLRKIISDYGEWEDIQRVFDSPNYVELDGTDPFSKTYKKIITKYYYTLDNYYDHSDAENDRRRAKDNGNGYVRGDFCTKQACFAWWKRAWEVGEIKKMASSEKLPSGEPYSVVLGKCCAEGKLLKKGHLEKIINVLTSHIETIEKQFPGRTAFQKITDTKWEQLDFVRLMLKESNREVTYADYKSLASTSSPYAKYAVNRIDRRRRAREKAESDLRNVLLKENAYKTLSANLASGKRAKLTAEQVNPVIRTVVKPVADKLDKAYSLYPEGPVSDSRLQLEQVAEGSNIAIAFASGEDVSAAAASFLEKHPQSLYRATMEGYHNDAVAIAAARALTAASGKEEIARVKKLPVTKDGARRIKQLTSKKYLSSK